MTESTMNVRMTMIEPVRLKYSADQAPSHAPIDPPASKVLPDTSALPKTRLRNALLQARRSAMPNAFV
jgi:hypothetical protein